MNNSAPVFEWLRALPKEDRQTIGNNLMRVQVGWPMGMPLVGSDLRIELR